jgi:hypothetical protein
MNTNRSSRLLAAVFPVLLTLLAGCGADAGSNAPEDDAADESAAATFAFCDHVSLLAPTVLGRSASAAAAYDQLLKQATRGADHPQAEVKAFTSRYCLKTKASGNRILTSAADSERFRAEVLQNLGWDKAGAEFVNAVPTTGAAFGQTAFDELLQESLRDLEERVGDGLWTPNPGSGEEWLYKQRADLVKVLADDSNSTPYLEISLSTNGDECSEKAVVRIDTRNGTSILVRRFPRC